MTWDSSENTSLKIETSLSLDGGTTWGDWYEINDNGTIQEIDGNTNLQNARIKYRVSLLDCMDGVTPTLDEVHIQLVKNGNDASVLGGKLIGISISSNNLNLEGEAAKSYNTYTYPDFTNSTLFDMSGDGTTLYYANPNDSNKLYKLNILSGETTKISNTFYEYYNFKTNYDGTKVCILANTNSTYQTLYLYDNNAATTLSAVVSSAKITWFDINNDGSILYYDKTSSDDFFLSFIIEALEQYQRYQMI